MIPFVKLYIRRFHVTSKVFLRKIAPKTSSNECKHEFSENKGDVTSNCPSSCPDYLGIESDENVITVKPQKHQIQQPERKNTREKFYRTSFGIVRLDADNKLKHHGQYRKRKDFSFPYSSSDYRQVENSISQTPLYKNEMVECFTLKKSQTVSAVHTLNAKLTEPSSVEAKDFNINYIDKCYFGDSEMNDLAQDKTKQIAQEELNSLERDSFETSVHTRNLPLELNSSKCADSEQKYDLTFCNKNQAEELNYLEKEFLGTLNNSANLHVEQDSAEYSNSKQVGSNLNSNDQSEELSYLEEGYFGNFNNSESHTIKRNISNCTLNEIKVNSAFNAKDQNIFFKNNNPISPDEGISILNKNPYKNCSASNDQDSIYDEDLLKSSFHLVENNNIINKDLYNNNLNKIDCDRESKNKKKELDSKFDDIIINEVKKLPQEQTNKVGFKKPSYKTQKSDTMSHVNTEPSIKNVNTSKELSNETIKSFSKENNFNFSKLVSEELNQGDDVSTADDFVRILRNEQNFNNSKGKSTNEVKFDSKGFRILSNQVPNLSYFTHDEILNILKQNIVYSDDDLLILNKPYSLVIHESQTTKEPCLSTFLEDLAKELDKKSTNPKLFTVHRLDKETTGCLLLARNETMAMHLKALFAQRKIVKKYWIITSGVPDPTEGVIDMPISEGSINSKRRMVLHPKLPSDVQYKNHSKNGKPAVTTYKVISESGNAALVEVFPKTGVKHQIRVHFGFGLGCPVLGDHKYSHLDKLAPQNLPSDMLQKLHVRQSKVRHIPMHIHAKSVGIPEYFDNRDLFVNIPIPNHFKINLKGLKFRKKNMIY